MTTRLAPDPRQRELQLVASVRGVDVDEDDAGASGGERPRGLQPPPGYGEPGVGKAVFSVSSFMDVLA